MKGSKTLEPHEMGYLVPSPLQSTSQYQSDDTKEEEDGEKEEKEAESSLLTDDHTQKEVDEISIMPLVCSEMFKMHSLDMTSILPVGELWKVDVEKFLSLIPTLQMKDEESQLKFQNEVCVFIFVFVDKKKETDHFYFFVFLLKKRWM